ncbi:MAG: serine/threonine-protein kinase, partial [Acidobacteria bacterium]|nr:serine/threonine-protein kinase [Acidobacteriota bacterium]
RSCGSPATLLVAGEGASGAQDFAAWNNRIAPLARASSIVHMLEKAGGSVRVHPSDPTSVFELLPPDESAWVVETGADAVVAVIGPGAEVTGILVVGQRFDDRIVRSVDVPFLETLAAAAGLAIARLRSLRVPQVGSLDNPPARQCPECGCLAAAAAARGCDCGLEYVETDVPVLLAGKYRLTRRLGSGGMGTAYAALDMQLQRDVAVKTLSGISVARLMALRSEGWAMASVQHSALAQIHGIESWRGRPLLVVEFLAGGTLADRLRRGPIAPQQAVAVTAALADALAALHAAGLLHRDIKPSNIAFTSDGSPKLLDFGLAGATDDTAVTGGTPRYASPEVLTGLPAGESDDVWSLCVVLYEMVSGGHPFAAAGSDEAVDRIVRQTIAERVAPGADADPPSSAASFAASILTSGRSSRPATARAFAEALKGIPGQGG